MRLFHLSLEMTRSKKESLVSDFVLGAFHELSAMCLMKESVISLLITRIKSFQDLSRLLSATDLHCDLGQVTEGQIFKSSASTTRASLKCISHDHSAKWRFGYSPVDSAPLSSYLKASQGRCLFETLQKSACRSVPDLWRLHCATESSRCISFLFEKCCPSQKGVP